MTATTSLGAVEHLAALRAAVDGLLSCDLSLVSSTDLVTLVEGLEVQGRRQAAVAVRVDAEVDSRGLVGDHGRQ